MPVLRALRICRKPKVANRRVKHEIIRLTIFIDI